MASPTTPARFFIVGAPKCGTTAWWSYLRDDPAVFLPAAKEVHHYDDDLLDPDNRMADPSYYLSLFAAAGPSQLVGEASPFHLYSERAAANIARARPDARIVAMVRNPVDLVYSLHSQLVYMGEEPLTDFAQALDAEEDRWAGRASVPPAAIRGKVFYRRMAALDQQLERYLAMFGKEQVHVVVYDDMVADSAAALNATRRFLDLPPVDGLALARVNSNKEVRSPFLRDTLLYRPSPVVRRASRVIPDQTRWKIRRALLSRNSRAVSRPPLPADLRRSLTREFEPVVRRLSHLLERDLRHWCSES